MGKSVDTPEMKAFLADLGDKESLEIDPDGGGTYISRPQLGFSLLLKEAARTCDPAAASLPKGALLLSNCFYYSEGHEGYSQFSGALPSGLSFSDSRDTVVQKLGPASWNRESKGRLIAERWDSDTRSLHITYTKDLNGTKIASFGLRFRSS